MSEKQTIFMGTQCVAIAIARGQQKGLCSKNGSLRRNCTCSDTAERTGEAVLLFVALEARSPLQMALLPL